MSGADRVHSVTLEGDAGIRGSADVRDRLKDALAAHSRIAIDTAGLTRADVTTVQTLLAARRQAAASGGEVTMCAPLGAALATVLAKGGFLAPGQEDAGFWPHCHPADGGGAA